MARLAAFFTAICIVLISISIGAVLYLYFGLRGPDSAIIAITALTGLALINAVTTRLNDRRDVGDQIADLSRGTSDLARQVGEFGRRLAALESRVETVLDRAKAATDPLAVEIGELGTLVKQLAESVALHEATLADTARTTLPASEPSLTRTGRDVTRCSGGRGNEPFRKLCGTVQPLQSSGDDRPDQECRRSQSNRSLSPADRDAAAAQSPVL